MEENTQQSTLDWVERLIENLPDLVPEDEIARLLHKSQRTISRWRNSGRIRTWLRTAASGTTQVLIPKLELRRLLLSMTGGAESNEESA